MELKCSFSLLVGVLVLPDSFQGIVLHVDPYWNNGQVIPIMFILRENTGCCKTGFL